MPFTFPSGRTRKLFIIYQKQLKDSITERIKKELPNLYLMKRVWYYFIKLISLKNTGKKIKTNKEKRIIFQIGMSFFKYNPDDKREYFQGMNDGAAAIIENCPRTILICAESD